MRGHVRVRAAPSQPGPACCSSPSRPASRRYRGRSGHRRSRRRRSPGPRRASPPRTATAAPAGRSRRRSLASSGRSARSPGSAGRPASGPASAAARCLNCSVVAAPSAKHMLTAVSSATSPGPPAARPAPGRRPPAPGTRAAASPPHTGTRQSPAAGPPVRTCVPAAASGSATSGPVTSGFRDRVPRVPARAAVRLRRERQRLLHVRPAQAAQHRGLVHPQPPGDLRVPHPRRPPGPRLLPRRSAVSRGRPAGRTSPAVPSRSDRWRSVAT